MISIALFLKSSIIYAVSLDCPDMVEFAYGLGLQTAQPAVWSALQSDCCTASGVDCDGSQRVWRIEWYFLGLNGVVNGTAIPSSVTHLSLEGNDITGAIPSALPSGLRELYIHGNQMSGDLPSFPSTLTNLMLGYSGYYGNHFTGTLRLNRPLWLRINDNWIADLVIQDRSVLGTCDLSYNPLLGNPNIAGLTMCTKNGLYSAALLPVTRSTLKTMAKTTTTQLTSVPGTTMQFTSVLRTTTQLESSEMTANGTAMTDGATTTVKTNFVRTTAQQRLSSEMTSGRMLNSVMLVTGTSTTTSSLGTVAFAPMMHGFIFNLFMVVRIVISAMLFTFVTSRTPFGREFKRMRSKRKTKTKTDPDF